MKTKFRTTVIDEGAPAGFSPRERDHLFDQFKPLVSRLLRKYGNTPELKSDLEGEIFCLFCELLEAFDPKRGVPLKAYLVHQLTSRTYTEARKHWRNEKRETSIGLHEEISQQNDPTKKWDEEILLEQIRNSLPNAISLLPQRQRQVLIWRYYEHRTFEEMAQVLEIQPATARSLLRHAITNLKKILKHDGVDF